MPDPTADPDREKPLTADDGGDGWSKSAIRAEMLRRRRSIDDPRGRAAKIVDHLVEVLIAGAPRVVMAYEARAGEPDLGRLLEWCGEHGIIVVLPVWDPSDPLARPMTEPDRPPDVVLVPAVAVTSAGVRLGRGLGWYDRYLAGTDAVVIGVCWDLQVVDRLPVEPHDVPLDAVVTESGWHPATPGDQSAS